MHLFILGIIIFLLIFSVVNNKLWYFWCRSHVCLVGKTGLVVGGVSGLGYQIALNLASRGCRVIIADVVNTSHAVKEIIEVTHNPNVIGKKVDYASFKSVRQFAKDILETEKSLHILMCNAGIAEEARGKVTEDGLHRTMQINYFSHFLLIFLLIDLLKKSAPSRIVFTSSIAAYMSSSTLATPEDGINFKMGRDTSPLRFGPYADSKGALASAASMFGDRLAGTGVTANAAILGGVKTNILQHAAKQEFHIYRVIFDVLISLTGKNVEEGVQPLIRLAVDDWVKDITGQLFYEGVRIPYCLRPYNMSKDLLDRLWNLSIKSTKLEEDEIKL